jgi:hypothetical protein
VRGEYFCYLFKFLPNYQQDLNFVFSTLYKSASIRPSTPLQMMMNEEKEISEKSDRGLTRGTIGEEEDDEIEQSLTAEQKMMLEMENETMMKELATALEQVK